MLLDAGYCNQTYSGLCEWLPIGSLPGSTLVLDDSCTNNGNTITQLVTNGYEFSVPSSLRFVACCNSTTKCELDLIAYPTDTTLLPVLLTIGDFGLVVESDVCVMFDM